MKILFYFFLFILILSSSLMPLSAESEEIEICSYGATVFRYYSYDIFLSETPENEKPLVNPFVDSDKYNSKYNAIEYNKYNHDIDNLNLYSNANFNYINGNYSKLNKLSSHIKLLNEKNPYDFNISITEDGVHPYIIIRFNEDIYYTYDGILLTGVYSNQDIELNSNLKIIDCYDELFLCREVIDNNIKGLITESLKDYFKEVILTKEENITDSYLKFDIHFLGTAIYNEKYKIQKGDNSYNEKNISSDLLKEIFPNRYNSRYGAFINIDEYIISFFYPYNPNNPYSVIDSENTFAENTIAPLAYYWAFNRRINDTGLILKNLNNKYNELNKYGINEIKERNVGLEEQIDRDILVVLTCENNNYFFKKEYQYLYNSLVFKQNNNYSSHYSNNMDSINAIIPYLITLIKEKRRGFIESYNFRIWDEQFNSNKITLYLSIAALLSSIISIIVSLYALLNYLDT